MEDGIEETDGLNEGVVFDEHDDVDGIEVALTLEASDEVGLRVGGGIKTAAEGTKEPEASIMSFVFEEEHLCDQWDDLDAVA